jgi:hypothetical protein
MTASFRLTIGEPAVQAVLYRLRVMEHGNHLEAAVPQQWFDIRDMEVIAEQHRLGRHICESGHEPFSARAIDRRKGDRDDDFGEAGSLPGQCRDKPAVVNEAAREPRIVFAAEIDNPHAAKPPRRPPPVSACRQTDCGTAHRPESADPCKQTILHGLADHKRRRTRPNTAATVF